MLGKLFQETFSLFLFKNCTPNLKLLPHRLRPFDINHTTFGGNCLPLSPLREFLSRTFVFLLLSFTKQNSPERRD